MVPFTWENILKDYPNLRFTVRPQTDSIPSVKKTLENIEMIIANQSPFDKLMEERFTTIVQPIRDYRAYLTGRKISATKKRKR